jgi:hypothetical protein
LPLEIPGAGVCATAAETKIRSTEKLLSVITNAILNLDATGATSFWGAQAAPQTSASYITALRAKCFSRQFDAQSFDALKLIVRPFFQFTEFSSLQCRKIQRNRGQ